MINKRYKIALAAVFLLAYISMLVVLVHGDPVGGDVTYIDLTYRNVTPMSRADEGGRIITVNVDATQQNYAWKAYVGNISGTLVLDDAGGRSIYGWSLATLTGEILVSRSASVSWSTIGCAAPTVIAAEHTVLNMGVGDLDNINKTFNSTTHTAFTIAGTTLNNCRTAYPYVNDTAQAPSTSALYQEILINDTASNLVYAGRLQSDVVGYNGTNTYDFQLLIPDNDQSGQQTTYYFYVELDS